MPDVEGDAKPAPVAEPLRAAPVRTGDAEAPAAPELAFERHKPSVAVLPFANVGGDPDHEYFAYGLTEDVIRMLGRNRWLTVLTRHSAAAWRGKDVDPREIGLALGVRYLVKGSVRKINERVRITA